mmetsp:Transcript_29965/g.66349  ORF Transcript_29965/g.66349 Transcript_29965/m.66349 type:complete len:205 (-) Transcript_29965:1398-2012(-)
MCVAHHGVQVDLLEGHLPGQLDAHHHHASHPEEQDVVAGLQQRTGIEGGQVLILLRPAEDREGEEAGGEPCVQHVVVLHQPEGPAGVLLRGTCPGLLLAAPHHPAAHVLTGHARVAALACPLVLQHHVVGRDAVAPPQLPADAPVLDVLQPVVVDLLKPVRDEADVALLHRLQGGGGQGGHAHKPLLAHQRLNDLTTALGAGNP